MCGISLGPGPGGISWHCVCGSTATSTRPFGMMSWLLPQYSPHVFPKAPVVVRPVWPGACKGHLLMAYCNRELPRGHYRWLYCTDCGCPVSKKWTFCPACQQTLHATPSPARENRASGNEAAPESDDDRALGRWGGDKVSPGGRHSRDTRVESGRSEAIGAPRPGRGRKAEADVRSTSGDSRGRSRSRFTSKIMEIKEKRSRQ